MKLEKTVKEVVKITGKTAYWLRNHECEWCSQTALNAMRYGCGSLLLMGEKPCNPIDKFRNKT